VSAPAPVGASYRAGAPHTGLPLLFSCVVALNFQRPSVEARSASYATGEAALDAQIPTGVVHHVADDAW